MGAQALAALQTAKHELQTRWNSINVTRPSGFCPVAEGGPLDDAVRDGTWRPELQVDMPMMGGLPGSRGIIQEWPCDKTNEKPSAAAKHRTNGGGWSSVQGGADAFGKGQTKFGVWANRDASVKTWRANGYERWRRVGPRSEEEPRSKDGAKKTENQTGGEKCYSGKI